MQQLTYDSLREVYEKKHELLLRISKADCDYLSLLLERWFNINAHKNSIFPISKIMKFYNEYRWKVLMSKGWHNHPDAIEIFRFYVLYGPKVINMKFHRYIPDMSKAVVSIKAVE